ncbi:MAG: phosphoenolpyruvate carboxylase [Bacteroidia bacterium]
MNEIDNYYNQVTLKYQLYNSLFLHLPFKGINKTGTLLPLFSKTCKEGLATKKDPATILKKFFKEYLPEESDENHFEYLFQFIQYIERQVVLFDSIEDASYEQIKNLSDKGSLQALASRVEADKKIEEFRDLLNSASVRIVLTAHPTQFYPGEVLGIITDLDASIRSGNISQVDLLLRQLGKTPFIKKEKPSPFDEAISLVWYLENIFYHSLPSLVHRCLEMAGLTSADFNNPDLFCIGFWPGGDRDGNPFVNAQITKDVSDRLSTTLMKCYYRDIRAIKRRLTFSGIVPKLQAIEQRIYNAAYGDKSLAYSSDQDLRNEFLSIKELIVNNHDSLFVELIDEFLIKLKLFGFHFARMDVRQHEKKHRLAWEQILISNNLKANSDSPEYLENIFDKTLTIDGINDKEASDFISSFLAIRDIQNANGELACNRYIISNSADSNDVLEVLAMAYQLMDEKASSVALDVIPLFESVEDLRNAPLVMKELFENTIYKNHLNSRNNKQTIMLGFSDGTKDGGYLQANWGIFKAKEAITEMCNQYNIEVAFFDGRGGPPGRGGGNTFDFYASQGPTISSKEIQLTIQGQTISSNYGKIVSCTYNLEQLFTALAGNKLFQKEENLLSQQDRQLLDRLAEAGYKHYLKIKSHKSFLPYLERATPLNWFGETNIGSRPAKRNAGGGLVFEDLRAIPFVGSWAQMKQNVPGYFGIGTAIKEQISAGKEHELIALIHKSDYLKCLFSNSMQSLTKCNFALTSWLGDSEEFGEFYKILLSEYQVSVEMVKRVMEQKELMEDYPVSKVSVIQREKIVAPLVVIQQFALQALNSKEMKGEDRSVYEKLILRCMFGIINAARNAA